MTEHENRVIAEARGLRSEHGENPEYDRALVEMSMRLLDRPEDDRAEVTALITQPQQSQRDLLAQDLREKYLKREVPTSIAERVFNQAWEDGHSAGVHEVEMHYDTLSELVNAAFRAGMNHAARWPNG